MNTLLNIYKPKGMTPLAVINQIKRSNPEYNDVPIGYAGRLDPLAHGVLLLMVGDATKERDKYLGLPKSYEFEAVFGFSTDTYDVMGYAEKGGENSNVNLIVNSYVNSHIQSFEQPYPAYSSKTIEGKPLFWWANEGKLDQITIPTREVTITKFAIISWGEISKSQLAAQITHDISLVTGDFRQEKLLKRWEEVLRETKQTTFQTAKFQVNCTSGTYIRGLINAMGVKTGTGAMALDILRTEVGEFKVEEAERIEV